MKEARELTAPGLLEGPGFDRGFLLLALNSAVAWGVKLGANGNSFRNNCPHHTRRALDRRFAQLAILRRLGPVPAGIVGVILLVVLVLVLLGRF